MSDDCTKGSNIAALGVSEKCYMSDTIRWTIKIALFAIILVIAIYRLGPSVPDDKFNEIDPVNGAAFQIVKGRPWVRMKLDSDTRWVLFDTGASYPTLAKDWLMRGGTEFFGATTTNGLLGSSQLRFAKAENIGFAHRSFLDQLVASSSGDMSIIGASIIFQLPHLHISKRGLSYGKPIDKADPRIVECVVVTTDRSGINSEVTSAYLHLRINGAVEPVLLDTGSAFLLIGTAKDIPKENGLSSMPRYGFFRGNVGSFGLVKYYSRTAEISIGDSITSTNYKSFPSLSKKDTKYYLGAPVFDLFDIYIDVEQGRACFLKREIETTVSATSN